MKSHSTAVMKSLPLSLLILFLAAPADAAPVLFGWGGEKIIKVMDFPDDLPFKTPTGEFVDAGYRYQQVTIFFIPVWNYNGKWCGYVGSDNQYVDLDEETLSGVAMVAGLVLPEKPSLPLWDSVGGKVVVLLVVLLYIGSKALGGKEDEVEPAETYGEPELAEREAA